MPATRIRLATRIKWQLFRLLERLSDLRGNSAAGHLEVSPPERPTPALWVFVSTIGELNAIEPFLRQLVRRLAPLKPVLITDHPHYRDSYLARYPDAAVCVTRSHADDAAALAADYPPRLLLVAEIPCWPADAPCRFSFAFLLEAKRRGAAACLVNGWLYHYAPPCRMDSVERQLFQRDYLDAFDAIGVQTPEVRDHLLAAGAPAARLHVTGNIKFDAMHQLDWSPAGARSPQLLASLLASGRPIIVAGCVTDAVEQELVLDAFLALVGHHPKALLILAPRHPEVAETMQNLSRALADRRLPALYRTKIPDAPLPSQAGCLVLDSIGELRDFYAAATVAHVGVDHNVLEPLAFGKPVTVKPGWEATYPSYPVYRMLMDAGSLLEAAQAPQLASTWSGLLDDPAGYRDRIARIGATLAAARGAVARNMAMIEPCLPAAQVPDRRRPS
jgi:3-deoxy-D-manno-octulosonic-acid transferase